MYYNSVVIRIALLFAALGSIVFALNHFKYIDFQPNDTLQYAYFVGAVITIYHVINYEQDHSMIK